MAVPLPTSLSPSKVSTFTQCALAFRFSAIDRLPEPPTPWTAKGTLVHRALERLFALPPAERTPAAARAALDAAWPEIMGADGEYAELELSDDDAATMRAGSAELVERYFRLEDPTTVNPIGLELMLTAEVDGLLLRGIIDRLELSDDGELVVTDYKTGRAPGAGFEQRNLGGVHFYALLCQQVLGRRPAKVQLLYLSEPVAITTTPTEQSVRGLERKVGAIWTAVRRACETDDFRPRPSRLCDFCAHKAFCPAFGGDPAAARAQLATAG